jgi:nucleoside-diphosphate-sugar epimerase
VVYLGSAAVHEPLGDGVVDESAAVGGHVDGLDGTLIDAERIFTTAASGRGLQAVVLRPAIVYGPRSPHWTMWQAAQMRTGRVVVPGNGRGVCNAVYVDDVVDAAIQVSRLDGVGVGPYLLNGPDQVTWAEFHRSLERALDAQSVVLQPDGDPAATPQRTPAVRTALGSAKRVAKHERLRPVRKHTARVLGPQLTRSLKRRVKRRLPRPVYAPDPRTRALYTATARIDDRRARAELGYAPQHDFERGMALTTAFLRWSNL